MRPTSVRDFSKNKRLKNDIRSGFVWTLVLVLAIAALLVYARYMQAEYRRHDAENARASAEIISQGVRAIGK